MPGVTRVLLVLLAVVAMTGGAVLLTQGVDLDETALLLCCTALGTVVVSPLLLVATGVQQRRMAGPPAVARVAAAVALQLAGLLALCTILAGTGAAWPTTIAFPVGAALLDAAMLAIGRAAGRPDARGSRPPAGPSDPPGSAPPILRPTIVGAAIGLLGAVCALAVIAGAVTGALGPAPVVAMLVIGATLGAEVGLIRPTLRTGRQARAVLGTDADRITDAIRGGPDHLDEEDRARAGRYVALALRRDRTAIATHSLALLLVLTLAFLVLAERSDAPVVALPLGASAVLGALQIVLRVRAGGAVRGYARSHPGPAEPPVGAG